MALYLIGFLIGFPVVAAALMWIARNAKARAWLVFICGPVIALATLALAFLEVGNAGTFYVFQSEYADWTSFGVDMLLGLIVLIYAIKYKKPLALVLALVQLAGSIYFEFWIYQGISVLYSLYIDRLSLILAVIVGVIGPIIIIYAVGYMRDFDRHHRSEPGYKDRRHRFFALMFILLSAMFVVAFSNNLSWLFTGWEVTTICSFLLIAYTKTEEAIHNAFVQIVLNLIGGIAFIGGLILIGQDAGTISLNEIIELGTYGMLMLPIGLICLSGLIKAAQMPVHRWLLGAMVAPTPTSALLHSSTMVKAGVFLLIKLAPCLGNNAPGLMVIAIGSLTFFFCSAMAISESNGKRVLAYSTISNLGLIAACAGIGTPEAVWAAIFLMIFHACTKGLLFMCVGTAEHHIGSRNIEAMDNIFVKMPGLAKCMAIGMMCMFIAPFGMLVSKWATIVAIIDAGHIGALILIAFGSAMTFFFWAKWLGKVCAVAGREPNIERNRVNRSEKAALFTSVALMLVCCILFPVISGGVVTPYLVDYYGWYSMEMATGNLVITSSMIVIIIAFFFIFFGKSNKRKTTIYLAGVGQSLNRRTYRGSFSQPVEATQRNWYLEGWFSAKRINTPAIILCIVLIVIAFGVTLWTGGVLPW